MYKHRRQAAVRELREKIWPPSWPSQHVGSIGLGFGKAIARGLRSEDGAAEVGV